MKNKLSVIIPVYNDFLALSSCIACLKHQSLGRASYEILVVDNNSTDITGKAELIQMHPDVTFLNCEIPGSYAARNVGSKFSSSEVLIFTDADCLPHRDWLLEHLNSYERSKDMSLFINSGDVHVSLPEQNITRFGLYDYLLGFPQSRYASREWGVTANLAVSKILYDKVGGFDERAFSGGDYHFCREAVKVGGVFALNKHSIVVHPARNSRAEIVQKKRRVKAAQITRNKSASKIKPVIYSFLQVPLDTSRVLKSSKLRINRKLYVLFVIAEVFVVELKESFLILTGSNSERR